MFRFEHISFLYALFALPVFWLIVLQVERWKTKKRQSAFESGLLKSMTPRFAKNYTKWKTVLFSLGYTFLVIALANPQIGSKLEEVKRSGIDLMICLDVSNSMLAEDLSPNRLKRAKRAMNQLVDELKGDRIGIVVFAGQAFVQLPITSDYAAAKLFLNNVSTNTVALQGTNMGAAVDLAIESFEEGEVKENNKAVVLITDGENHEDNAVEAVERAQEQGIRVFTIGMGSEKGAPIPVYSGGQRIGYLKDKYNQTIITQLNSSALTELADIGNGFFHRATNADAGLKTILEEISGMDKTEFGSKLYTDYEDRYPVALAIALFFFSLELFLSNRKPKWLADLNLFGEAK